MSKLFSVTIFTAFLTLFRMISGFIIAKVVAVYTGPSGIAMLGQVQSLITSLNGVVVAPVGSGVVRYTAEHSKNGYDACAKWWQASLHWAFGLVLLIAPITMILSGSLSTFLFQTDKYSWVVIVCCLVLPLSVINTALISVINGQQQYKRYVSIGFISVILSTLVMLSLIYFYGLKGALLAVALNSSLAGFVVLVISCRQPWFKIKFWFGRSDYEKRKAIGSYVIMAIASAIATPLALVLVRNILISYAGWEGAGQWQAVWKISEVYLAIITMGLSTYYLPQLSKLQSIDEVKKEINQTTRAILPLVIFLAVCVYFSRDLIIFILFTDEFKASRDLFGIQLVGDVIKILSWLYAFPMLARGATKWFVFSEIFFATTLVLFSFLFIHYLGLQGANWAYLINYSFYFLFVFFNVEKFAR
ncbi:O-antigen translocase [Enterobacteriaceae bacterium H16N7]|nr:O-antigen translocase [Dryocola clanedunensis]